MTLEEIAVDSLIRKAWRAGLPMTEIAALTGLSWPALMRHQRRLGLPERDHLGRVAPQAHRPAEPAMALTGRDTPRAHTVAEKQQEGPEKT